MSIDPRRHWLGIVREATNPTEPPERRGLVMATTIGEQLRLAREESGIPLREISNQTRISVRYLEAIEASDYKRLPGGIFNRSFVKAYAKCIGFDERQAVEGYMRVMREQGNPVDDEFTVYHSKVYTDTPATRSPVLTVFLAILILAVLTLGALAALHWYQKRNSSMLQSSRSYEGVARMSGWQRGEIDIGLTQSVGFGQGELDNRVIGRNDEVFCD